MGTLAVLPVKSLGAAKRRLSESLPAAPRRALVEAMLADVLTALRRARRVDATLVVSGDPAAQAIAAGHGAQILEEAEEQGHSAAAARGVARALELGHRRVLLVPGDTPALEPAELDGLIEGAVRAGPPVIVVGDRHGTGTNALLLCPPDAIAPSFGPGSLERHLAAARSAGLACRRAEVPSLALDVDTLDDFWELRARLQDTRGGSAHTRGLLLRMERTAAAAAGR